MGYSLGFRNNLWFGGSYGSPIGWGYNDWGYYGYSNPYYIRAIISPTVIDYSQPITLSDKTNNEALRNFDAARSAFKSGNDKAALHLVDKALQSMPNDLGVHEFRALVLFSQGKYAETAAVLHRVLSVGAGWNWTTMSSLYPSVDVYTAQLRALEQYRNENRESAEARFVLAYHYLSCDHPEAAIVELKKLVALRPEDRLSVQILEHVSGKSQSVIPPPPPLPGNAKETPATEKDAAEAPKGPLVQPGNFVGAWKATRKDGATFALTLKEEGTFTWVYTHKGEIRKFDGKYTHGNGLLTLVRSDKGSLVGRFQWNSDKSFGFKIADGAKDDPGLTFQK